MSSFCAVLAEQTSINSKYMNRESHFHRFRACIRFVIQIV